MTKPTFVSELQYTCERMQYFLNNTNNRYKELSKQLSLVELEGQDLLHDLELGNLNARELVQTAVKLKDVRKRRRVITDEFIMIRKFHSLANQQVSQVIKEKLSATITSMNFHKEDFKVRTYHPRVLHDLKLCKIQKKA